MATTFKVRDLDAIAVPTGSSFAYIVDPSRNTGSRDTKVLLRDLLYFEPITEDHDYFGPHTLVNVGSAVVFGQALYLKTDASWYHTSNTGSDTVPAGGIALGTAAAGGTVKMLLQGRYRDDSLSLAAGRVFTGSDYGTVVDVKPSGSGRTVQPLGFAVGSSEVLFIPDTTTLLLA